MSGFAAGLLVGQLSVLIVLVIIVRFFLFTDSVGAKGLSVTDANEVQVAPETPSTLESVLEHTYYDVENHSAESMDWFTVLVALVVRALRLQASANHNLLQLLNRILRSDRIPSFVGTINVTELNLGADYPLLNNCRVVRSSNPDFSDGLEAQFDVDLKDTVTLGIETQLLLNYPRPKFAILPVRASVSLVNFSGRISVSLVTGESEGEFYLTFTVAPNFSMEFEVHSLVGARSKLQDVPKLGQIVENTLRRRFADQCVSPNFQRIKLPMAYKHPDSTANATMAEKVASSAAQIASAVTGGISTAGTKLSTVTAKPATTAPVSSEVPSFNGTSGTGVTPDSLVSSTSAPMATTGSLTTGAQITPEHIYDPVMQRRIGEKYGKVANKRA